MEIRHCGLGSLCLKSCATKYNLRVYCILNYLNLIFILYWSIADLQWRVSSWCAESGPVIHVHTHNYAENIRPHRHSPQYSAMPCMGNEPVKYFPLITQTEEVV